MVDEVWKNQPPAQNNPVNVHPLEFAGCTVANKLKNLRQKLKVEGARAIVITTLDEVSITIGSLHMLNAFFMFVDKAHILTSDTPTYVHSIIYLGFLLGFVT